MPPLLPTILYIHEGSNTVKLCFIMDKNKVEQQYLKVTKIFANLAGTWPYQRPLSKLIIIIISCLVSIPAICTQVRIIPRISFSLSSFLFKENTRETLVQINEYIISSYLTKSLCLLFGAFSTSNVIAASPRRSSDNNGILSNKAVIKPRKNYYIVNFVRRLNLITSVLNSFATKARIDF